MDADAACLYIYILIVIEHGHRRVHIAGITAHPTRRLGHPQARNLLTDLAEGADRLRSLIRRKYDGIPVGVAPGPRQ